MMTVLAEIFLYLVVFGAIGAMYYWLWRDSQNAKEKADRAAEAAAAAIAAGAPAPPPPPATPASKTKEEKAKKRVPENEILAWWACNHAFITGVAILYLFGIMIMWLALWASLKDPNGPYRPYHDGFPGAMLFWPGFALIVTFTAVKPKIGVALAIILFVIVTVGGVLSQFYVNVDLNGIGGHLTSATPAQAAPAPPPEPTSATLTISCADGWVPMRVLCKPRSTMGLNVTPRDAVVTYRLPDGTMFKDGAGHEYDNTSNQIHYREEWQTWQVRTDDPRKLKIDVNW